MVYMKKHTVDLAIHPRWIIPMVPRGTILQQLSVIVNKGKIVDILPEDVKLCFRLHS